MRLDKLLDSLPKNYTSADRELVLRAYEVAEKAHSGQKRASGEPYVTHCVAVASILAEMRLPPTVVAAGLLHDTVEDTSLTLEDLRNDFGEEIARLVDGVTKLAKLPRVSRSSQPKEVEKNAEVRPGTDQRKGGDNGARLEQPKRDRKFDPASETLRKTFLAMGDDVRVVLIKLADRLHNMRTIEFMPEHKRRRIAQETLDIFAPLANRLGIWQIKGELEDLAFPYVYPEKYAEIHAYLEGGNGSREQELQSIQAHLQSVLGRDGILADITTRQKHIYSIFTRMQRKNSPIEMVQDIRGVRIIVPDVAACYTTLGIVHTHWRPIPGQFDDYIAVPKDNFYRSLHTAVVYEDGKNLEIQIRTPEMNQNAEYGIAAHWRYKEGSPRDEDYERRIVWLRSMMDWRQDVEDAREFVDSMKTDVFEERVFVFTPHGDMIDLPVGSTPIDFAYHVHTDIGHRCRGAKVNGKLVSLNTILQTGDKVEILTTKRGGPSQDWLNTSLGLVKTQTARTKIRRWFKYQDDQQNIERGRLLVEKEFERLGIQANDLKHMAEEMAKRSERDLFWSVGVGEITIPQILSDLKPALTSKDEDLVELLAPPQTNPQEITVLGLDGLPYSLANCCRPTLKDEITGFVTKRGGVVVHRRDCIELLKSRGGGYRVNVTWGIVCQTEAIQVRVKAFDRNGLLRDISTIIGDEGLNMRDVKVRVRNRLATIDLILEVQDILQLSRILNRLETLSNVILARRMRKKTPPTKASNGQTT